MTLDIDPNPAGPAALDRSPAARENTRVTALLEMMSHAIEQRSAQGIAVGVSALIRDGVLPPGTRLPTVRHTAAALHVSATTVTDAWRRLAREGLVRSARRSGTIVLRPRAVAMQDRSRDASWAVGLRRYDFSNGTPDHELLPSIQAAMRSVAETAGVTSYSEPHTMPELADLVRARWRTALAPEEIIVTNGAFDAIDRLLRDRVHLGDRVLVEDPTQPTLIDTIESFGGIPVPVHMDHEGMVPEALRARLALRPVALVLQPRAQNPTGISTTPARAGELGRVLAGSSVLVIEDDHTSDVATAPLVSVAPWHPDLTVHVESFSKAYGPDLRLAAVGGPRDVLDSIQRRRSMGPGWSARILQQLLVFMLSDPATQETVTRARTVYQQRRRALMEALGAIGLPSTGTDGLNLWVEVPSEREALRRAAAADISINPGTPFTLEADGRQFIRITIARIDDPQRLAEVLTGLGAPTSPA
ncbi:aminotransferase-like domain-containing protein [Actinotalea fermentans]|uniref:GntR family transcriptional regulator n=1 Tax=Actinotalea fermentans TaxID=43671 RepID=A0A511YXD6_9CELL|nr:aminotransferase class I/II-fold pyridoxal phosphate-dependent enzyme [Actinotalea fermentans]GEN79862.1 GntR family transcriptional regulator [Actinotalea fermentans]